VRPYQPLRVHAHRPYQPNVLIKTQEEARRMSEGTWCNEEHAGGDLGERHRDGGDNIVAALKAHRPVACARSGITAWLRRQRHALSEERDLQEHEGKRSMFPLLS
jgi:hypothetical protein